MPKQKVINLKTHAFAVDRRFVRSLASTPARAKLRIRQLSVALGLASLTAGCWFVGEESGRAEERSNGRLVAIPDPLSGENPRHTLVARVCPRPGERFIDARFGEVAL